jgi:hypothetical protein
MKTEVTMKTLASLITLAGLLLAACQPLEAVAPDTDAPLLPPPEPASSSQEDHSSLPQSPALPTVMDPTTSPASTGGSEPAQTPGPVLQGLIQQAREDLANRLKVGIDQIELLKVVPAQWPYDSVGCPLPDSGLANTGVVGYLILLMNGNQIFHYYTDGIDWVALCNGVPPNEIRTFP